MKTSRYRVGAEDIRFASDNSHIDNKVYEWKMSPEELAAYKEKHKSKVEVDKLNGLRKEIYIEMKNEGKKDTDICKLYKLYPLQLVEWKKETFTKEELRSLNLPKRAKKDQTAKTIQKEIKPQEKEIEKNQTQEETIAYLKSELQKERENHTNSIKKLNEDAERGAIRYERAIKDLEEKLGLEQEAKKRMAAAHQTNIQQFVEEKELAYQKAKDEEKKYLDTLEKYKEADYQLQNAKQRIAELESERDQYKMRFEEVSEYANKARAFLKVAL